MLGRLRITTAKRSD